MMKLLHYLYFPYYFFSRHTRLSNWNTGRLFMGDDFGMGVSEYGAVAVGTGEKALVGQNAQVS